MGGYLPQGVEGAKPPCSTAGPKGRGATLRETFGFTYYWVTFIKLTLHLKYALNHTFTFISHTNMLINPFSTIKFTVNYGIKARLHTIILKNPLLTRYFGTQIPLIKLNDWLITSFTHIICY